MKHLVPLALAALLLVGCKASAVAISTPEVTPSATATAVPTATPDPRVCSNSTARGIELNPPAPAPGETVIVRAHGLNPGDDYYLSLVPEGRRGLSLKPVGTGGPDGRLETRFQMPAALPGLRMVASLAGIPDGFACSSPFVTLPSRWGPDRCEALPDAKESWEYGLPLKVSITPTASGVDVSATGPREPGGIARNGVGLTVVVQLVLVPVGEPLINDFIPIKNAVQVDQGIPTVKFSLNEPRWAGYCVRFTVNIEGPGPALWYGKFDYPPTP